MEQPCDVEAGSFESQEEAIHLVYGFWNPPFVALSLMLNLRMSATTTYLDPFNQRFGEAAAVLGPLENLTVEQIRATVE